MENAEVKKIPDLEVIAASLLAQPVQAKFDLTHSFAKGIYLREILMLKDTLCVGHEHKIEHFNIVLSGRALVYMDGKTQEIVAPCYFKSGDGVQKLLYILEDMRWITVHANPDDEHSIEKLEDRQVNKSETFLKFRQLMEAGPHKKSLENYKPRKEEINL